MIKNLKERVRIARFAFRSLTFNSVTNRAVVLDTAFEPVFWIVDHFLYILGPAFVIVVFGLITSVVVIYYTALLPPIVEQGSRWWTAFHLVIAHWLLVNIVFHYFKSVFTSPGYPPQGDVLKDKMDQYQICKKCVQPKPPRAHHCSVCKRCVLKMDHHCPWINNCVGHFNHRYFILFCIYMCLGTIYVSLTSFGLFLKHFFHSRTDDMTAEDRDYFNRTMHLDEKDAEVIYGLTGYSGSSYEHGCSLYIFMLCSSVTLALGILTMWHSWLIAKGETSIEIHINRSQRVKLKKKGLVYRNPYDYGIIDNWKLLLGLVHGRSLWHILLPSLHHPYGDGIDWPPPPSRRGEILPV